MQDIRSRQARPNLAAKHPAKHHLPSGSLQHSSSLASYGNKQKPITLLAAFQQARAQLADQQIQAALLEVAVTVLQAQALAHSSSSSRQQEHLAAQVQHPFPVKHPPSVCCRV